jgi:hypothetical protein
MTENWRGAGPRSWRSISRRSWSRSREKRCPEACIGQITFTSGDMLSPIWAFDHVMAMDDDLLHRPRRSAAALAGWRRHGVPIVFTVAPRTPFLMAFWPRASCSRGPTGRPR